MFYFAALCVTNNNNITRSSAVALIADRTGKLCNRFWLQA